MRTAPDRRWIHALLALALCIPLAHPFRFAGTRVTPAAQTLYDRIEKLPPASNLLVSFDFDPAAKPELEPQARALLQHAFRRHLTVFAMGLQPNGWGMAQRIVRECAQEAKVKAVEGQDYVLMGSQLGGPSVILGLGQSLERSFPKDARGLALADLPALKHLATLKDIQLIVTLGDGDPGPETWILYGGRYAVPTAAGTTSGNSTTLLPYVQGRQLVSLLSGLKGAAEYEILMQSEGNAVKGMDSLTLGAFLFIILVCLANLTWLVKGRP